MHLHHSRTPSRLIAALAAKRDQTVSDATDLLHKMMADAPDRWIQPLTVVADMVAGFERAEGSPNDPIVVTGKLAAGDVVPLAAMANLAIDVAELSFSAVLDLVTTLDAWPALHAMIRLRQPLPTTDERAGEVGTVLYGLHPEQVTDLIILAGKGFHGFGMTAEHLRALALHADNLRQAN